MERLITRLFIFAGLMTAIAGAVHLSPKSAGVTYTEDQIEEMTPSRVNGVPFETGSEDMGQTYKMSEMSYEALKPFGIVCRVFDMDGDAYDTVVIASRSKDSFHDPRVCFAAQGWNIERFEPTTIKTQTRGELPAMLIEMYSETVRRQMALFLYKGPEGFYASSQQLKIAFLVEHMKLQNRLDGVFYRFIPSFRDIELTQEEKEEKLKAFVADYMDEANKTSNGYL